jgi:hypothetical protein
LETKEFALKFQSRRMGRDGKIVTGSSAWRLCHWAKCSGNMSVSQSVTISSHVFAPELKKKLACPCCVLWGSRWFCRCL